MAFRCLVPYLDFSWSKRLSFPLLEQGGLHPNREAKGERVSKKTKHVWTIYQLVLIPLHVFLCPPKLAYQR